MSTEYTCPLRRASSRFLLDMPCAVTVWCSALTALGSVYVFCMAIGLTEVKAERLLTALLLEDRYALLALWREEAKGVSSVLSITPS